MSVEFEELSRLDEELLSMIKKTDFSTEVIDGLVDKRADMLKELQIKKQNENLEFKTSQNWLELVKRTEEILKFMESETENLGQLLKKYRHGNKSIKSYTSFR